MELSIHQLSKLAGVSTRTLRYYDEIGLLEPIRVGANGYRYYGAKEVELLQQILFFRERQVSLDKISEVLYGKDYNGLEVMGEHLADLRNQRKRLDRLIVTVKQTIADMKGEIIMSDTEKFAAFKDHMVEENEEKYGTEIRGKYGDKTVDESNRKMLKMSPEEYQQFQKLGEEIITSLRKAVQESIPPESEEGGRIALLHKKWLMCTWSKYSYEAHKGLTDMYVADERFKAYYDKDTAGCAGFLRDAVYKMEQP